MKYLQLVGIIIFFIPAVFWVMNPELTEMQLFLKYWYYHIVGLIIYSIGDINEDTYYE